jgi:hypothetical protein
MPFAVRYTLWQHARRRRALMAWQRIAPVLHLARLFIYQGASDTRVGHPNERMGVSDMLERAIYWFVAGALIGFGVIAILSIGVFTIAAGLILVVFGAFRVGARGLWAALVGGGLVPLAFLLNDLQNSDILPATTAQTYQVMAQIFGAIALIGVLWGIVAVLRGSRPPAQAG